MLLSLRYSAISRVYIEVQTHYCYETYEAMQLDTWCLLVTDS